MNAGIFGIAGNASNIPRTIGILGKSSTPSHTNNLAALPTYGFASTSFTPVSGVRQRVLSVNGKGMLHAVFLADASSNANTWTAQVVIDGTTVINLSWTHGAAGYGPVLVGVLPSSGTVLLENIPFTSSVEVFATATGTITTAQYGYLATLYQ